MAVTKQQVMQALNKGKYVRWTTSTGSIIVRKKNKTDYDFFVFEEGVEEAAHYLGFIHNVMLTMNDKNSNKDFEIVDPSDVEVQHS